MTIATLLVALIATSAADHSGDPVLLDFHADWCPPCRSMRPEVDKLVRNGYPIKSINVDQSPELSERYQVKGIPAFVVVDAKGKVLARTAGAMPAAQLASFYNETILKPSAKAPVEEAQEREDVEDVPDEAESKSPAPLVNPKPWQTVVRIKMHLSDTEWGFGSGTIIYSSAEESIILTCAHIFRVKGPNQPSPKAFKVPISVDLFSSDFVRRAPDAMLACTQKDIPGEAIDYDFTNDVGLIRIKPGRKLPASRVVPTWWKPQKNMKMYTVGCSHGNDATAWNTTILDPRIPMSNTQTKQGFATIKCAYQPKEGRSGGGLYTTDGYVAGVCDFADPNEHVGLYAVPEAIHRLLDRNSLMALYQPPKNGADSMLVANRIAPKASTGTRARGQSPEEATDTVTLPPPKFVGITAPPADSWKTRSTGNPAARSARPQSRAEVADAGDPGARAGEAVTTDLSIDPGPEGRQVDNLDPIPTPGPRPRTPAPSSMPRSSGWKPVRQALPELEESRP